MTIIRPYQNDAERRDIIDRVNRLAKEGHDVGIAVRQRSDGVVIHGDRKGVIAAKLATAV